MLLVQFGMLYKAHRALLVCVASVLVGRSSLVAFTSLTEYFADDVISVPAFAPYVCELKVEACSDANLLSAYKDFVSVHPPDGWSQFNCHAERVQLWGACGAAAKVVMKYSGPWSAGPVLPDGSWLIQSLGSTGETSVVIVLPTALRPDHRCFLAKKLELESASGVTSFESARSPKETIFCIPAIDIVGYPKCGTSAAYELLTLHEATLGAARRKEMCMVGWKGGVWNWIEQLEPRATKDKEKLLVNGCFIPNHVFSQEVIFRLYERPNAKVFVVRDLPERMWSAWNFWCDPKQEEQCDKGQWTKIGVHERSPELFQQLLLDSAEKGYETFRNVPAPASMETYYLNRFMSMNGLSPFNITAYAKEKLETEPAAVWERIARMIKEVYGRDLAPHDSLHLFSEVLVNTNDAKGPKHETRIGEIVEGTYEISGHQPLLEASRRHIMESWTECSFWATLVDWPYPCVR